MTLRLTVVGSGDAFNAAGRAHSCYLLERPGAPLVMVDFGATALARLHQLGQPASEVSTFVFTHLHGDHIGGTPFLLIDALFADRRESPLRMVGPTGLEARVRALLDVAYGADILAREGAPELVFEELEPGSRATVEGFKLETFPADHQDPPETPLCLRFTAPEGQIVAFSGDTAMCEGLLSAGASADLLVAECSGLEPPMGRHCTWEDWARVLPELSARRVLLTHLGREVREAVPRLLEASIDLLPAHRRLDFADDGQVLDLLPPRLALP